MLAVAGFRGLYDPVPVYQGEVTWERLARRLQAFPSTDDRPKDILPVWAPARFEPARRRAANAVLLSAVVLDFDRGSVQVAEMSHLFPGFHLLAHTTMRHRPDAPRFRVVLPLQEPAPVDAWRAAWKWAMAQSDWLADRACSDPGRAWRLPFQGVAEGEATEVLGSRRLDALECWGQARQQEDYPDLLPGLDHDEAVRLETLRRLAHDDAEWRIMAARLVRAEVCSGSARRAPCPRCHRPSVWWPLEPTRVTFAMCSHRRSCGWIGPIERVVGGAGGVTTV